MKSTAGLWNFFRTAGVLQAVVDKETFSHLKSLPNENWAVLSCPVQGLNFDSATLAFMDANADGHIRIEEVLDAVEWTTARISNHAVLLEGTGRLELADISSSREGAAIAKASKELLAAIGKEGASSIALDDVLKRKATFLASECNGDGVIVITSVKDGKLKKLYGEIISATGGALDRSGSIGVDEGTIDAFYKALEGHLEWIRRGEREREKLFPLGGGTDAAIAAIEALEDKIDDFFAKSAFVSYDGDAIGAMNGNAEDFKAIAASRERARDLPLMKIGKERNLVFGDGINPEWRDAAKKFLDLAAAPFFGSRIASLSREEWQRLKAAFSEARAWRKSDAGSCVSFLAEDRVLELLGDTAQREKLLALIAEDKSTAGEIGTLDDLEKLLRYKANLKLFLNNYLNFSAYYDPKAEEIFRAGSLYVDGRVCRACVYVANLAQHSALAAASKLFLAYCEITRPQTGEKKTVCAAVTAGFASSLWVGRNGIFYDTAGRDWNAVIVKIAEAPIGLKEAFWAPWLKISDLLSEQIRKLVSAKESAIMGVAAGKVSSIGGEAAPGGAKRDGAALASSVAAIGIAIGIIGSALGGLISALKGISPLHGIAGVLAIILLVSGPAVILAWFKLRSRDFAPVLNGCGWAVNKRMRMPIDLGREFTHEAVLPEGSKIKMRDPYARRHAALKIFLAAAALIAAFGAWLWMERSKAAKDGAPPAMEAPADAPAAQ